MNIQEFEPQAKLQSLVKCYWTLEIPFMPEAEKQRVLPDGCIEMVFMLGDDVKRFISDEEFVLQPRAMIMGQISEPMFILPVGKVNSFAVRFFPYAFANFSLLPMNQLANKDTPLDQVIDKEIAEQLEKDIVQAGSTEERIRIVENFLLEKIENPKIIDSIVKSTVDSLLAAQGSGSIKDLVKEDPAKRRQLERKFSKSIGISPKQLGKIFRLQASLQRVLNQDEQLTDVAYDSNFYDQSHFIKDFKEFTGTNPKDFYHNDEFLLSSLLYGSSKDTEK
jgi:AraC-like DNA-binding protein